ncbi:MAG: hypothetical protein DMF89_17040 [Acidobacteria bacterium]|nr:MAG: hypothetical protein DMF89_17040 [Acidobacteriota bacterium]
MAVLEDLHAVLAGLDDDDVVCVSFNVDPAEVDVVVNRPIALEESSRRRELRTGDVPPVADGGGGSRIAYVKWRVMSQ